MIVAAGKHHRSVGTLHDLEVSDLRLMDPICGCLVGTDHGGDDAQDTDVANAPHLKSG